MALPRILPRDRINHRGGSRLGWEKLSGSISGQSIALQDYRQCYTRRCQRALGDSDRYVQCQTLSKYCGEL
ncbi:unnamed protein product, partial [Timema podura]|nr:unnamed protein product [Timema podura]